MATASEEGKGRGGSNNNDAETASVVLGSVFGVLGFFLILVAGFYVFKEYQNRKLVAKETDLNDLMANTQQNRFTELSDMQNEVRNARAQTAAVGSRFEKCRDPHTIS